MFKLSYDFVDSHEGNVIDSWPGVIIFLSLLVQVMAFNSLRFGDIYLQWIWSLLVQVAWCLSGTKP